MRKQRSRANLTGPVRCASSEPTQSSLDADQLRRKLAEVEAELSFQRSKQEWLQSSLAAQRHARQMLEAGVSANYGDTVERIRQVVSAVVPAQATLLVISKGDEQLLQFEGRRAWHFPRNDEGVYAGHYPADSAAAISHLKALITKGGQFLLIPNTAFWWLEHYGELKEWLETSNSRLWRDERCAIYKLMREPSPKASVTVQVAESERAWPVSPARSEKVSTNGARSLDPSNPERPLDVLCFPIIDWDFRFQRPQQLMLRFAAAGHRVFYLAHRFRKSGEPYALRPVASSLWEVSLLGPGYNVHDRLLDDQSREALFDSLSHLCRDLCFEKAVAVVQSPFWWPLARRAASTLNCRIVYDCMDHHAGFSNSNPILVEQERELLAGADLVVTSSAVLENKVRPHCRNVALVRNGCDYYHFAKTDAKVPGERPVIGYYGAISDWFDSELVADLAKRRPEWDFVLVGSTLSADLSRLSKLPNVSIPGEKPYQEIPDWLAKFDVTILPFKRTPLTDAANPVKAYEIFATGKPLVSVPLPEMIPLAHLARLASTVEEFEREIQAELNQTDPAARRKRRAFARNNTWEERYQKFYSAMRQLTAVPLCCGPVPERQTQTSASFV